MMRVELQNWINGADNVRHLRLFSIAQWPVHLAGVVNRNEDFYISLVGELFNSINSLETKQTDWSQLGNAFLEFSSESTTKQLAEYGISHEEATLFAAAAFYFGDFPASACLTMRRGNSPSDEEGVRVACFDFLARPSQLRSKIALQVRELILIGDLERLREIRDVLQVAEQRALKEDPERWIMTKLLNRLMASFSKTNLRAVLPGGQNEFWTPLIKSFMERHPSTWEFFPSQIEAIEGGLLTSNESYSLQMPTGAGKTTLCETLLYGHLKSNVDDAAVMLVPFRSLASELRGSLVRSLNSLGLASRCAYGGSVPTGDEVHDLANIRALIATPEALSGILGADSSFAKRISLVICDEGHLLDSDGRGIALELLLARLRARKERPIRFVFMSAIVPNIEEINAWLGGTDKTVVRSLYRPAIAEFAVLKPAGTGVNTIVSLEMHPHESKDRKYSINGFLERRDFSYLNQITQRPKTYNFSSIKAQAIGAARKALQMGATAIFAMNKRGDQGAIGIAEALLAQLDVELSLPTPISFARQDALSKNVAYLEDEYGLGWVGARCLKNGIVLHHGDIPQETREILEGLLRSHTVMLVICTKTLAEGVNLPIRTLVLYSVQQRDADGRIQNMLARDIKNLVGRAGRAGANTKGLVICANPEQWRYVQPVAMQGAGESVKGSLFNLINNMTQFLAGSSFVLSNEFMETNTIIHPLIDGVDSTLIELLSQEIGKDEFVSLAVELAAQTLAAQNISEASAENLRAVFALRATRLLSLREGGRIWWARETGAKIRLIESVEQNLLPLRADWQSEVDPNSAEVRSVVFQWAWMQAELREAVKRSFRLNNNDDPETIKDQFFEITARWLNGMKFSKIADELNLSMDELLAIHAQGITFALHSLVEQGISLLAKRLEADGITLASGFSYFPEHLKFGSPTVASRLLAASGVRHRKACVHLGNTLQALNFSGNQFEAKLIAANSMKQFSREWREILGELVFQNTLLDLSST